METIDTVGCRQEPLELGFRPEVELMETLHILRHDLLDQVLASARKSN